MKQPSEFLQHLLERMQAACATTGTVSARAMFGGYGLYFHDLQNDKIMFALVADEVLYLKTDAQNRGEFEQRRLPAFSYEKNGKLCRMSYAMAPEETLEDSEALLHWMLSAIDAARRSRG